MNDNESSLGLSPRVGATLAYLGWWITGAIFWFLERRDAYVRFHAAQSLAAFGLIALLVLGLAGLAVVSLSILPALFTPLLWAAGATWVAGIGLWAIALWCAASGRIWRIPLADGLTARLLASSSSPAP